MSLALRWYSPHLQQEVLAARWGQAGQPVLLFPTAGGDAEECERFLMIKVLTPLIEAGRIRVYSCDSAAGPTWINRDLPAEKKPYMQNRFDEYIERELVPWIRSDSGAEGDLICAGYSMGAYNSLAAICRHPELFKAAICLSGGYEISRRVEGFHSLDLHYCDPLHFLPFEPEGPRLERLRQRMIYLVAGEGPYENPPAAWKVARILGSRRVPNRVDLWGPEHDHDWVSWRHILPQYLDQLTR
jgi:esterase/lipase superfamily enzyme